MLSSKTLASLRSRFGDLVPSAAPSASEENIPPPNSPPRRSSFSLSSLKAHFSPSAAPPVEKHKPLVRLTGLPSLELSSKAASSCDDVPIHPDLHRRFLPIRKLGQGGYASVVAVRERTTGSSHVIKVINNAFAGSEDAQRVVREVAYQRSVTHPNLLPLTEAFYSRLSPDLYLLCPMMECDLHAAIHSNRLTTMLQKQCVCFQLTCALGHMHACGMLHRDLKPQNVLLDSECNVKLCDFGLVRSMPSSTSAIDFSDAPSTASDAATAAAAIADGSVTRSPGSRWYRAPELLFGASSYGPASDMWSLGCVIAELLSGSALLLGVTTPSHLGNNLRVEYIHKVLQVGGGKPDEETLLAMKPSNLPAARALIASLPAVEPLKLTNKLKPSKPSGAPADGVELCSGLLRLHPGKRYNAEMVLSHAFLQPFVAEQATARGAYAAASIAPPANGPFRPPLDDDTRLTPAAYRDYLEGHLATALVDPAVAAPAGELMCEEDMGA